MACAFADAVGLRRVAGLRWYAAALGAAVVAWLFSAAFAAALTALGCKLPREDVAVFRLLPGGPVGIAFTCAALVVVAPFAEEVVYRGVLLFALSDRWGAVAGLAVSTVVFSAVHLSLGGFVPLLVAGALFGLAVHQVAFALGGDRRALRLQRTRGDRPVRIEGHRGSGERLPEYTSHCTQTDATTAVAASRMP